MISPREARIYTNANEINAGRDYWQVQYNLKSFEHDGLVYIKIVKRMYGLPQVENISNELVQQRLKMHDSHQACGLMFGDQLSLLW